MSATENIYTCCFTGHRNIPDSHADDICRVLDKVIENFIEYGTTVFRAGGAIGFDTVAALKIIEKKAKYPHVRLELFLPYREQSKGWNDENKAAYNYVLDNADKITYTAESYFKGCMMLRNRRLVDGADLCIAYCTQSGGSAYTLRYAQAQGLRTINIASMLNK